MTAQVAADLRAAAELLKRDGWVQGAYKDACGRCITGALISVTTEGAGDSPRYFDGETYQRFRSVRDALGDVIGGPLIAAWNDQPGRVADEVIAALLAAADAAERDAT